MSFLDHCEGVGGGGGGAHDDCLSPYCTMRFLVALGQITQNYLCWVHFKLIYDQHANTYSKRKYIVYSEICAYISEIRFQLCRYIGGGVHLNY